MNEFAKEISRQVFDMLNADDDWPGCTGDYDITELQAGARDDYAIKVARKDGGSECVEIIVRPTGQNTPLGVVRPIEYDADGTVISGVLRDRAWRAATVLGNSGPGGMIEGIDK
jgi:hypothetical protein